MGKVTTTRPILSCAGTSCRDDAAPCHRTGFGFDSHEFASGAGRFMLGGVAFRGICLRFCRPFRRRRVDSCDHRRVVRRLRDSATSVLFFRTRDPSIKGISSLGDAGLGCRCSRKSSAAVSYAPNNVDAVVVANHPKLTPVAREDGGRHRRVLSLPASAVSLKGKPRKGLPGSVSGGGIAVWATATVVLRAEAMRGAALTTTTLTGAVEPFQPMTPGQVKLYVCGITPYDESHLGHARCYVVFDVLKRVLLRNGHKVLHVQNFTDVDDKIIDRACQLGVPPGGIGSGN